MKEMSWLSGLAGKAEELLNKIDQNAAEAFNKKTVSAKPVTEDGVLTEVTSLPYTDERKSYTSQSPVIKTTPVVKTTKNSVKTLPVVRSTPDMSSKVLQNDDQLIEFLNGTSTISIEDSHPENKMKESVVPILTNGRGSPSSSEVSSVVNGGDISSLESENQMLRNEVRSLNNEMSLLLHRTKAAERESERIQTQLNEVDALKSHLQEEVEKLQFRLAECEELVRNLQIENNRLAELSASQDGAQSAVLQECKQQIEKLEEQLNSKQVSYTAKLTALQERLNKTEYERTQLETSRREVQNECESLKQRLVDTKAELEQYRTRAQRTLNDKEKLIAELRNNGNNNAVDLSLQMELQQLRDERNMLSTECQHLSGLLDTERLRVSELERTLEAVREESSHTQQSLQEALTQQTRHRQVAEEDCRAQTEELHAVREELNRQRSQLSIRLQEREAELTRLRTQLSQRPASPPHLPGELEMRLSSLTKTLIQKQSALELVTTERNELRVQIEEMEHKHREQLSLLHQRHQNRLISANDTDDAKAQVPRFMIESPFDTGMTRRVKRAYSSLDAVSIRTGVFLRRYPFARIFVLCYVVILQLWVFFVLFSRTPDNAQS